MKITEDVKKDIKKWIKALRSGKYKQTKRTLEDAKGYCCLGVGCKIFIPDNKLKKAGPKSNVMNGGMPEDQRFAPRWLKEISDDFEDKTNKTLYTLNDAGLYDEDGDTTANVNFDEIADLVQAVYLEGALD